MNGAEKELIVMAVMARPLLGQLILIGSHAACFHHPILALLALTLLVFAFPFQP